MTYQKIYDDGYREGSEDATNKLLGRIAELEEKNLGLQDTILRLSFVIDERKDRIAELEAQIPPTPQEREL